MTLSTGKSYNILYNMNMHIGDILKAREIKSKRGTHWTDMVKECVVIINEERLSTKYPQLSFIAVRNKVAHLDDASLAYLVSICKDAKNRKVLNKEGFLIPGSFSKVFFGALKVKNDNTTRASTTNS